MKRIGVVGVPGGWSSEALADQAALLSGGPRILIDPGHIAAELDTGKVYYRSPRGEKLALDELDALILKKMGPEYHPGLLDRLDLLRFVEARGVRIFSRPGRVMRLLDRLSCTVTLVNGGIPMPPTVVTEDPAQALDAVKRFGRAVCKPLFSTKARGMTIIDADQDPVEAIADFQSQGNQTMYIQQMMALGDQDLGMVFLGGEYLATYARAKQNSHSWNTTTRDGGKYIPFEPDQELIDLAHRAQALFSLDFTCVDVALTPVGPVIFEVSAFGGFRGLKDANGLDAARLYVEHVLRSL